MRTGSPDTLAGKLFALFAEVAFKNHPVPVDFQLSPQVGKTIAVDPQFQKLSRFVLSKQAARPADRGRNIEYLTDSMFGKVPNPCLQIPEHVPSTSDTLCADQPIKQLGYQSRCQNILPI